MKVEDGLTFVLEFLDILPDTSIRLVEFLVAFLPRIKYDGLKQLFVFAIGLDGFQELNELLLEYNLLYGFGMRTLLAPVVVVRMTFASATTRIAPREWLIAVLANNEPSQRKLWVIEYARLALEMQAALHTLALSE
ncbi:MAG TPA: hypothetical protein VN397_03005 [Candidatus Methylomirabilis sp.]|nr:hypothetical protein [Candidatus Methylomirabilis sp.]